MGKQHKNAGEELPAGRILLTDKEIQSLLDRMAAEIERDFSGRECVVLGVLKGAFIFMADLVRRIQLPITCDFIRVSSYSPQGTAGPLRLEFDLTQPVVGKDILVLEDVVDTGRTLGFIRDHLLAHGAKRVFFGALVQKKRSLGVVPVDYVGQVIPDDYVIGYGMDQGGRFRNLPWVQTLDRIKS